MGHRFYLIICSSSQTFQSLRYFNFAVHAQQEHGDDIDSAFTSILSQIDTFDQTDRNDNFGGGFGFGGNSNNYGNNNRNNNFGQVFPRVKTIAERIHRLVSDLYSASLGDEAQFLKQSFVELGYFNNVNSPFGGSSPFQGQHEPHESRQQNMVKKVDELEGVLSRLEKQNTEFKGLSVKEREQMVDKNRKAYSLLNNQHGKILKKCYYTKTRIEYLLNELYNINGNKNLMERLVTWKKFIENNEYVLNNSLTRAERELLYSFLAKKLRDTETDMIQAEELVFALV